MNNLKSLLSALALALLSTGCLSTQRETGFASLFDGLTLNGWKHVGPADGYGVKDGVIFCSPKGENLFTKQTFSDFILRFEFKLEDGSNNGIGIRSPFAGNAAYLGMEIQVLDDAAADRGKWGKLRPEQYHGSIYDVVPARCRALKPVGEWNTEEITADGRQIRVVVNGITIVDANLNRVTDPEVIHKHPGLFRDQGHIGFLGHGRYVEFRNLRVKELARPQKDGAEPAGFTSLFNGKDLGGWKGVPQGSNDNPIMRAMLPPRQRAKAQPEADDTMRMHWKVENGEIVFDRQGRSLRTAKDYANFELLVDWKIPMYGDGGINLRGLRQVQIWDPFTHPTGSGSEVGSGGFYNHQKGPNKPLRVADKPIGEWNRFRILMVGEKAHVFLNGELVVNNTTLENPRDYAQPVFASGPIELQDHGSALWFKNIYLREIPAR